MNSSGWRSMAAAVIESKSSVGMRSATSTAWLRALRWCSRSSCQKPRRTHTPHITSTNAAASAPRRVGRISGSSGGRRDGGDRSGIYPHAAEVETAPASPGTACVNDSAPRPNTRARGGVVEPIRVGSAAILVAGRESPRAGYVARADERVAGTGAGLGAGVRTRPGIAGDVVRCTAVRRARLLVVGVRALEGVDGAPAGVRAGGGERVDAQVLHLQLFHRS